MNNMQNNNPFNQGPNPMNSEMMKQYRTKPIVKYGISIICGLVSFIVLIICVGTTDIHFPQ